jgi:serine/threonine protein kinase
LSPWANDSGLSPSIEILRCDEITQVMSMEEAGAKLDIARLGPYELGECIGKGGMAVVYKAKVVGPFGFEKQVVIKQLQPALMARPEFFELFTQEARITAQLGHPGIVQVHDFGIVEGIPFLVMEFLDGVNLAQVMRQLDGKQLPIDVAVIIVTQVCHALGYAHSFRDHARVRRQVVHGDVSPSNIMACRDGTTKLLDFGVARLLGEFDFEMPPMLTGKSAYMAPEQLRREPFDRRVDVFAAGIVLHELLTGRRLFAAKNDIETLHRVLEARAEPPSHWNPCVPWALDQVVMRALSADPGARYESGEEMARALESACRVAGGRRRVAEYLETLFTNPGEMEASDGTLLTSLEGSPSPLPPAPMHERPVAQPFQSRPRSITQMVQPLPKAPKAKNRRTVSLAILSGVLGFVVMAWLPTALETAHAPRPQPNATTPKSRRDGGRRILIRPALQQVAAPQPTKVDAAVPPLSFPEEVIQRPRARKTSASTAPRPASPKEEPATRPLAPVSESVVPVRPPRIKDGRLLDPFGASP